MAVRCEFIDIIVPISNIDRAYPGGFAAFRRDNARLFGGRLWHDKHLLRDGAMSPADAQEAVQFWESRGLQPSWNQNGKTVWKDLCVVEHTFGGPTLPCDWIVFDANRQCVYLKGDSPDPVIGREDFTPHA